MISIYITASTFYTLCVCVCVCYHAPSSHCLHFMYNNNLLYVLPLAVESFFPHGDFVHRNLLKRIRDFATTYPNWLNYSLLFCSGTLIRLLGKWPSLKLIGAILSYILQLDCSLSAFNLTESIGRNGYCRV